MKIETGKKYAADAREQLKELSKRIGRIKGDRSDKADRKPIYTSKDSDADWDAVVTELRTRAHEAGAYLEELGEEIRAIELKDIEARFDRARSTGEKRIRDIRDRGEKRLSEVQAMVETGLWDIRAALQRASEGVEPLLHRGEERKKAKYFLQHSRDGRWALVRDGATSPTMHFETKGEGVAKSREYVRDRRPSVLVIRRSDGTFQHVHKYR